MGIFALAARYGENIMDGDERRKVQSQLEAGYPYDGTEADKRAAMLPYLEHTFALNILEDAMDTVVRAAYVRSNPLREPDYSPDAGLKKIKEMASEFFDGWYMENDRAHKQFESKKTAERVQNKLGVMLGLSLDMIPADIDARMCPRMEAAQNGHVVTMPQAAFRSIKARELNELSQGLLR